MSPSKREDIEKLRSSAKEIREDLTKLEQDHGLPVGDDNLLRLPLESAIRQMDILIIQAGRALHD